MQLSKKELVKKFDLHIADSGFNCIIKVPGRDTGLRGYGNNLSTKTGPIYDFIKDSVHYYDAVYNHLKECTTCDPTPILQAFLTRHVMRREVGISKTFHSMAMRYVSRFPNIPNLLIHEIQARYEIENLALMTQKDAQQLQSMSSEDLVRLWLVAKIMVQ